MVAVYPALELLDDVPGGRRQLLRQGAFLAKRCAVGVRSMLERTGDDAHGRACVPGESRNGSDGLSSQRLLVKPALAGDDEIGGGYFFWQPECSGDMCAAGQDANMLI